MPDPADFSFFIDKNTNASKFSDRFVDFFSQVLSDLGRIRVLMDRSNERISETPRRRAGRSRRFRISIMVRDIAGNRTAQPVQVSDLSGRNVHGVPVPRWYWSRKFGSDRPCSETGQDHTGFEACRAMRRMRFVCCCRVFCVHVTG